jgi:hypothetical protein
MRTVKRLQLVVLVTLLFSATVGAKCPTGSVTVRGKVNNRPSTLTRVEVLVLVETANRTVSRTASLSDGEFTVEVPFSTRSSSFLGSDSCRTEPTFVEVRILSAGKIYVQKRLSFKDSFEMTRLYEYRLKQELSLDVAEESGNTPK